MRMRKTTRRSRFASAGLCRLSAVLLVELDRADAAIVNADVPGRYWLHSPAESLVAVSTASGNGGIVWVARVKARNLCSGKSFGTVGAVSPKMRRKSSTFGDGVRVST